VTRLTIVHTESSLGWGGQEIRILSESQGLIRRGHDVRVLCAPEGKLYTEAPSWKVPAIALPIARKRPLGAKVLFEWLRRNRCDIVSTHSSTDSWLAALALLALGRPVRMVRTRHISAPVPRNMFSRWLYTRATARIVTAGEALRKELIERNGFPAQRIDSVPTGIDATRFKPGERDAARAALGLPADKTLVGIVATLRSWKGHRFLIEAVAQLPARVGLVIVGDGPMRDVLQADVERHAMRERVWFAGNQRDVLPWLQALDVFALPSYANEGVPQALTQAMLVGLACVTTHAGSIAELARHAVTALVVPPRDVSALRSALEKLTGDPELRKRLGEEACRHCSQHFSYDTMLDRMEAIYRQVSGRPGRQ
jgi:glycosyltransferase involved in cell wall biosynthesis